MALLNYPRRYAGAVCALAGGLILVTEAAYAGNCNGVQVNVSSSLNVRSGPGTNHGRIGSVYNGQRYYKVSTAANGWIRIQFDSRKGYIHPSYATQGSYGNCKSVTASNLNIRSGAGTGYAVVGTAPNGSRWFRNSSSGSWTRIHYGGANRWGHSSYLVDVGSTPQPPSGDVNVTDYNSVVTASKLNVRSGPGTHYRVVGSVSNGTVVRVTHHNGSWRKIRWGSGSAYVHGSYIARISSAVPNITNFRLNNGATETSNRSVTLNFSRSGAYPTHYRVSESSRFTGATWRTYRTPIRFTLSNRAGSHRVYFQLRDSHGRVSTIRSDAINYFPGANVPAKYDCSSYMANHPRARSRSFTVQRAPERGVYVIETFIPPAWVRGHWYQGGFVVEGKGDDRNHSSNFNPERTRAYTVLDFENGTGCIVSNESQIRDISCGWGWPRPFCWHKTFDARQVNFGANNGLAWVDTRIVHGEFIFAYGLQNSVWGSEHASCAINHQFQFSGANGVSVSGDSYPSVGVYQYPHDGGRVITKRRLFATELDGLCDTGG